MLCLIGCGLVYGQEGRVAVCSVTDAEDGSAVPFADVIISDKAGKVVTHLVTKEDGSFGVGRQRHRCARQHPFRACGCGRQRHLPRKRQFSGLCQRQAQPSRGVGRAEADSGIQHRGHRNHRARHSPYLRIWQRAHEPGTPFNHFCKTALPEYCPVADIQFQLFVPQEPFKRRVRTLRRKQFLKKNLECGKICLSLHSRREMLGSYNG